MHTDLDCIVIGYNELPFERYEKILCGHGADSEAYRDLKFSFVELEGHKYNYADLLNHVIGLAKPDAQGLQPFRSGAIPNLAAAYLANYLRRRGFGVEIVNLFQDEKDWLLRCLERKPRCIAITTTLYVVNFPVNDMVQFIRQHDRDVKIVVGGPLVSNHARNYQGRDFEAALDDMGADIYVIEGQGESALSQIVAALGRGGDLSAVPNLAYHDNGCYRTTGPSPENNSMDENYIDWRGFSEMDLGPTLQTRTARSCAFNCAFCNYPTRAGKLTLAGLETIERELDSMAARRNVQNVVFIDDTFNVPLKRFKDICRLMIRKEYGFNWFSYFRCSNSDPEAIDLMAQSGCKGVFLGIESGSPTILKNMHKAAKVDQYLQGIGLLKEHGILTFGSFILGFPGETPNTIEETQRFVEQSGLDYFRTQLWYNEMGTPIQKRKDEFDIFGEGFVWEHATMDSMEAMDHIERVFLGTKGPTWLPQWSFDFWIIPYLMGRGISLSQFRAFTEECQKLLALEIAYVPPAQKNRLQARHLSELTRQAAQWSLA